MNVTEWPPQFKIKRHWRARHVKMAFSSDAGLEITLPKRFSTKHLPSILEENKEWILNQQRKHHRPEAKIRPQEITFLSVQKTWTVHYFTNENRPRIRQFNHDGIILSGNIDEYHIWRKKLNDWVMVQAKRLLPEYISKLAQEIDLTFSDISVRAQTTLWGSCSHDKSIRLNYKLIFLPEALMRHIMIHELCHTMHMDHSDKFWLLVAKYDANWREHKRMMRHADQYMPAWI